MNVVKRGYLTEIEEGVTAPHSLTLRLAFPGYAELEIDIAEDPAVNRFTVQAIRSEEIDGAVLRMLALNELMSEALVDELQAEGDWGTWLVHAVRGSEPVTIDGMSDAQKLEAVVRLYRLAYRLGLNPTATTTRVLGKSRSTISRMLAEARDHGLLGPAEERRAGI